MSAQHDRFVQRVHEGVNAKPAEVSHTPGPWTVSVAAWGCEVRASASEDVSVAWVGQNSSHGPGGWHVIGPEEALANAKAIAAAPDMADAIRRLAPYLNRYCDLGWPGLSERDRDEANNARVDLLNAAGVDR